MSYSKYEFDKLTLADSLQLDHEACGNLNSMITPCCGDLRELKGSHYHRIIEITENAGKCLLSEYVVSDLKHQFCIVCIKFIVFLDSDIAILISRVKQFGKKHVLLTCIACSK